MRSYIWQGIDKNGKKIQGKDDAKSKKQLKFDLTKKNILPLKIKPAIFSSLKLNPRIKPKYITLFIDQLATLINANIPLIQTLTIISQDEQNHRLSNLIIDCKNSILEGKSLYDTLHQYPKYFSGLICGLIKAGEQSGTLDIILKDLANHLKKSELQKNKAIKALIYPIALLTIAILVTLILLIFVIPQLAVMFDNFGETLPSYTIFIINLSNLLKKYWLLILAIILGTTTYIKISFSRSIKFRHLLDKISLNIPLIKDIIINSNIIRFTNTTSLMLEAGIPLLNALEFSSQTISSLKYKIAIQKTKASVANGKTLHSTLRTQNLFPNRMIQLIAIGEETGKLDHMLKKTSLIYDEKLSNIIDNLNNLLEPVIVLILGSIIGSLVIGMYLPIFRLGAV